MIKEPPVLFTPWTLWVERNDVPNAHLPGVYLLAHWEGRAPGQVDPLAQAIVYIGEAGDQSLMGRWQQFHRAAFTGKPGHSGDIEYHEMFGEDKVEELFVAAFVPEGLSREMRTLYIRYVTQRLIWEWAKRWDGPPACNRK